MFTTPVAQKVLALLAALWGGGGLLTTHLTGETPGSTLTTLHWLAGALGALLSVGPSWRLWLHKIWPAAFPAETPASSPSRPAAAAAADAAPTDTPAIGEKEMEVELFRCQQELVEAAETRKNVVALDHFRDGWVALFNARHRDTIVTPSDPAAKPKTA